MRPREYNPHANHNLQCCTACGETKPVSEFEFHKPGGKYTPRCSACILRRRRELAAGAPKSDRLWTPAEIDRLRWAATKGFTSKEAVAFVGRSINAVKHQRARLSLPFFRTVGPRYGPINWPPARVETLRYLRCDLRLPFPIVARKLGCSKNAAIGAYYRHVLPERPIS